MKGAHIRTTTTMSGYTLRRLGVYGVRGLFVVNRKNSYRAKLSPRPTGYLGGYGCKLPPLGAALTIFRPGLKNCQERNYVVQLIDHFDFPIGSVIHSAEKTFAIENMNC